MLRNFLILTFILTTTTISFGQGKVYFVIGSDTGIWQGLDVARHTHHYNQDLYTNPQRNAYDVMKTEFRNSMQDSYGTPMKLTWWMMAGNTFRYADNTNVPNANSIIFYLMKKYHGEKVESLGDELSLHYHTFTWTDYDRDGQYWWNQALTYEDYEEDFQYTLAQLLIDENIFPVSFRSGWHYMDNQWQKYLEKILPYSLHNDYPYKHTDTIEPLDNLFDWSQATSEFVPYHPSESNYQISGNLNGYNVRSVYTKRFNTNLANQIFQKAENGTDQLVCIWSHLPEHDFLDQLERVDSVIHNSAANFPTVNFEYCTGVEGYQKYLNCGDDTKPQLNFTMEESGDEVYFNISSDEPIFQTYPFVAVKNLYEQYQILPCTQLSNNSWKTNIPVSKSLIAKAGAAITDTAGNLSTKFINVLPDEIFIDHTDPRYSEEYGNWGNSNLTSWGLSSRISSISAGDSAKAIWNFTVEQSAFYNLEIQVPEIDTPAEDINIILLSNSDTLYSNNYNTPLVPDQWNYLTSVELSPQTNYKLETIAQNYSGNQKNFASNVIKISPLVKDKELKIIPAVIDFSSTVINDTASLEIEIRNNGINELTVHSISSVNGFVNVKAVIPITVGSRSSTIIPALFFSDELGPHTDTLIFSSDDPVNPQLKVLCNANVENPFKIIDNEDANNYSESGAWQTSVTQAYGNSSRYGMLNQSPLASATFKTNLDYSGVYDIYVIIPETENSSDKALYSLTVDGIQIQSKLINQNEIGGAWHMLFRSYLPAAIPIEVKVEDSGTSTVGPVLRADAIKLQLISEITDLDNDSGEYLPEKYSLHQNYPNPFNPSTTITFSLVTDGIVKLKVFDLLGRKVKTLINSNMKAGIHTTQFNAQNLASGVYLYRLETNGFVKTRKMILLR